MVDRVAHREAAEQRGRAGLVAEGLDVVHVEAAGDAFEDGEVLGFDQADHVGALGEQHLDERVGAALAAGQDVIGTDAHGVGYRALKSAGYASENDSFARGAIAS